MRNWEKREKDLIEFVSQNMGVDKTTKCFFHCGSCDCDICLFSPYKSAADCTKKCHDWLMKGAGEHEA